MSATHSTATAVRPPISKLYKRCAWNHHSDCPGSFEAWSICSCSCHVPPAEIVATDSAAAVAEAVSIVTPVVPNVGRKGTLRQKCFLPCPEHAPAGDYNLDEEWESGNTLRLILSNGVPCDACSALTLQNARAYAKTFANKRHVMYHGYNSSWS